MSEGVAEQIPVNLQMAEQARKEALSVDRHSWDAPIEQLFSGSTPTLRGEPFPLRAKIAAALHGDTIAEQSIFTPPMIGTGGLGARDHVNTLRQTIEQEENDSFHNERGVAIMDPFFQVALAKQGIDLKLHRGNVLPNGEVERSWRVDFLKGSTRVAVDDAILEKIRFLTDTPPGNNDPRISYDELFALEVSDTKEYFTIKTKPFPKIV